MLEGEELHSHLVEVHEAAELLIDENTDDALRQWHAVSHAQLRWGHTHEFDGAPVQDGVGL